MCAFQRLPHHNSIVRVREKPSLLALITPMQKTTAEAIFCFVFQCFSPDVLGFSGYKPKKHGWKQGFTEFFGIHSVREEFPNQPVPTHRTALAANQMRFLPAKHTCSRIA